MDAYDFMMRNGKTQFTVFTAGDYPVLNDEDETEKNSETGKRVKSIREKRIREARMITTKKGA